MSDTRQKDDISEQEQRAAARIEWVLAGIAAVLLLSTICFLGVQAVREGDGLPDIELTTRRVEAQGQRFTLCLVAHNRGETAAGDVQISGELRERGAAAGAEPVETSACTLDYVPSHSRAHGALVFTRDPAGYDVELRVTGYQQP